MPLHKIGSSSVYIEYPAVAEPRIQAQLNKVIRLVPDAELNVAAKLVAHIFPFAGDLLDRASKDKLQTFISTTKEVAAIAMLSVIPDFYASVLKRVNTLEVEDIATIVNETKSHELIKPRALELLSYAFSFAAVNDILDRAVLPIFDTLSVVDIGRIIQMPSDTGADLIGANMIPALWNKVQRSELMSLVDLNALLASTSFRQAVPPPPIRT